MKHIIYAFLLLNVSCFRFRIQELSPSLVTQIPLGTGLQEVQAKKVNKAFANLPLSTPIISDKIYIPDYESSLIKVFNTNSDMEYIIGNPELQEVNAKKYRILFHRFSAIGNITVDESDDLYIQNILS
ncbi:MAG: hypothetical protein KDK45_19315, partial [Leptospiraceae bacterium]|nr:hypothetical protein [Leptospiraceae bacterium]